MIIKKSENVKFFLIFMLKKYDKMIFKNRKYINDFRDESKILSISDKPIKNNGDTNMTTRH